MNKCFNPEKLSDMDYRNIMPEIPKCGKLGIFNG
jgi:hypothetical protein